LGSDASWAQNRNSATSPQALQSAGQHAAVLDHVEALQQLAAIFQAIARFLATQIDEPDGAATIKPA